MEIDDRRCHSHGRSFIVCCGYGRWLACKDVANEMLNIGWSKFYLFHFRHIHGMWQCSSSTISRYYIHLCIEDEKVINGIHQNEFRNDRWLLINNSLNLEHGTRLKIKAIEKYRNISRMADAKTYCFDISHRYGGSPPAQTALSIQLIPYHLGS